MDVLARNNSRREEVPRDVYWTDAWQRLLRIVRVLGPLGLHLRTHTYSPDVLLHQSFFSFPLHPMRKGTGPSVAAGESETAAGPSDASAAARTLPRPLHWTPPEVSDTYTAGCSSGQQSPPERHRISLPSEFQACTRNPPRPRETSDACSPPSRVLDEPFSGRLLCMTKITATRPSPSWPSPHLFEPGEAYNVLIPTLLHATAMVYFYQPASQTYPPTPRPIWTLRRQAFPSRTDPDRGTRHHLLVMQQESHWRARSRVRLSSPRLKP